MHNADKQFKCDKPGCTFETNFSSGLKKHLLVHEDGIQSHFPLACSFPGCHFRRKRKSEMVQHELRHETCKVPLKCKICLNSGYLDKLSLRFHNFKYHDQRSWNCSMCDYAVCFKSPLQRHIQTHHRGSIQVRLGQSVSDKRSRTRTGTGTGITSMVGSGSLWKRSVQERIPVVILDMIDISMF